MSRFVASLVVAVAVVAAVASGRAQKTVRYEHRVVVPTTARLYASEINESLERNVNALAARGFELTAIVGGDVATLDAMLTRRPYLEDRHQRHVTGAGGDGPPRGRPAHRPPLPRAARA